MLQKFKAKGQTIRNSQRGFLCFWIGATAIGYAGGGMISAIVANSVGGELGLCLSFAVISIAIALTQWLVIRTQIIGMGWLWRTWLGGTLGGIFSAWASFHLAITYGDAVDLLLVYGCLRGMTTGIAQWTILRNYSKLADWWIVSTAISWYISILVGSFVMDKLGYFVTLLVGLIYGLLTGLILLVVLSWRTNTRRN